MRVGLARGRAQAVARFTETFTIFTTTNVLDEATGLYTPAEDVLYTGVEGRVKYPSTTVMERAQGGQVPAVQDVQIHVRVGLVLPLVPAEDLVPDTDLLPSEVTLLPVNVLWRCESSVSDPTLEGRVYRTKGEPQSGNVTAHRYPVERVN